jgi:hypothetical protein
MKPLAPYEAVGEGFRLIRREPRAFFVWTAIWFATFSLAAWTVATSRHVALAGPTPASLKGISEHFGPYSALFIGVFPVVWLVTAVAAFRAVLRPDNRRWFFLRLSMDEVRLGGLTLGAFFAAFPLGAATAYLVLLLIVPFMHAVPTATGIFEWIGAFLTVALDVWLGVRLSLIAVETFSERRFHLTAYWPVTQGRFWYLLEVYFLYFLMFLGLSVIQFALVWIDLNIATDSANGLLQSGNLLFRAGILTAVTATFISLTSTLFYACQAHAFREIIGQGRAGVPPA